MHGLTALHLHALHILAPYFFARDREMYIIHHRQPANEKHELNDDCNISDKLSQTPTMATSESMHGDISSIAQASFRVSVHQQGCDACRRCSACVVSTLQAVCMYMLRSFELAALCQLVYLA